MRAAVIAPESIEASRETAAAEARSACAARRSTSSTKSSSGVSTTRAESARQEPSVRPIGVVTHATVASCWVAVAASTGFDLLDGGRLAGQSFIDCRQLLSCRAVIGTGQLCLDFKREFSQFLLPLFRPGRHAP